MELEHISHASCVVHHDGVSVLCDPWLDGGAFYDGWAHSEPLDSEPSDFADVDYIYVSHIHPDHLNHGTLAQLPSDIPVFVHDFKWDFVSKNVEAHGFDAEQLNHGESVSLTEDFELAIYAADDCDPEVCGNHFGCSWWGERDETSESGDGSTMRDTLGVFSTSDGETLVNANDCQYPLSEQVCERIREAYDSITLLLVQFSSAFFYPQCVSDLSDAEKRAEAERVKAENIEQGEGFIRTLQPDYYMPFGMQMALAGRNTPLNEFTAYPKRHTIPERLSDDIESELVLLNERERFDLTTERQSAPYTKPDPDRINSYIEDELASWSFDYESDPMPAVEMVQRRLREAWVHLEEKRQQLGYETDTTLYLELSDREWARFGLDGTQPQFVSSRAADSAEPPYVKFSMDRRLLNRILKGPRHAHFNNAITGSHLRIAKDPAMYERPVYYLLSFLHT